MTAGTGDDSGRPGLRANALPAAGFARLLAVDARVSEALLDVLEDAGIAAYVEPSAGEVGIYRDIRAYRSPADELYVDRQQVDAARGVVAAEMPGMLAELSVDPAAQDEAFAAIIAGFDSAHTDVAVPWHESEDTTATATDVIEDDKDWYAASPSSVPRDEEEEGYVPPPPPPLPRLSGAKLWGMVLLFGGLLLIGLLPLLDFTRDEAIILGILTTAGGAGLLVWQMRDAPADSDPDDGAVV